mgnify:CR=1 FL=1
MAPIYITNFFEKQFLNIARLFKNLIKSDYFNTFRYKFLIVIYNIELYICKGEKTKGEREKKKL